jgi:hypothetical protein
MRCDQMSLLPRTIPTDPPSAPPVTGPPTLWQRLEPSRRRQLAQHVAELIRRLRPISAGPRQETPDECH